MQEWSRLPNLCECVLVKYRQQMKCKTLLEQFLFVPAKGLTRHQIFAAQRAREDAFVIGAEDEWYL